MATRASSKITILLATIGLALIKTPLSAELSVPLPAVSVCRSEISFVYASPELWRYLRQGLNYLESPKPLLPPETVPPRYIHPDSRGFGPYGFSPEAYSDVRRLYPFFKDHPWSELMASSRLYDLANQAFADMLLKNLQDYIPSGASRREIFSVLQQAWNLGLSGFKKGGKVVPSRSRRAEEFLSSPFLG